MRCFINSNIYHHNNITAKSHETHLILSCASEFLFGLKEYFHVLLYVSYYTIESKINIFRNSGKLTIS